jgi:AcrR family transcriptional regulator
MKVADPGRQRRGGHLLEAAREVIAGGGFAGVSMRSVAAAAGVSLAQVQYYFRSKDELLAAAFEDISDDIVARASMVRTAGPVREGLRALLEVWLPLDEARTHAARVWLAFTAAAATSETLGPKSAALDAELRGEFAGLLRQAQAAGELEMHVDVETEAALLLAVVDGLVLQALARPTADRAELLTHELKTYLSRLFARTATSASGSAT